MSEEQLAALLARLQEDAELMEKVQAAEDLDAAEALVQEAGFDVSKADWLKYQDKLDVSKELSDEELEGVAGGKRGRGSGGRGTFAGTCVEQYGTGSKGHFGCAPTIRAGGLGCGMRA